MKVQTQPRPKFAHNYETDIVSSLWPYQDLQPCRCSVPCTHRHRLEDSLGSPSWRKIGLSYCCKCGRKV